MRVSTSSEEAGPEVKGPAHNTSYSTAAKGNVVRRPEVNMVQH